MKKEIRQECERSSVRNKNRTAEQYILGGRRGWCSDVTLVRAPPAMTWRVKMNPPLQGCRGSSRLSTEYLTSSSHSTRTHACMHTAVHTHTCTAARPARGTYEIGVPMFPLKSENSRWKKKENWKRKMKNAGWQLTKRTRLVTERLKKHHAVWLSLCF